MRLPFRPRRKVIDPWGREWELYVSRVAVPAWRDGDGWLDDASPSDGPLFLLEIPVALVSFVWSDVLVPLLRLIFLTPFADLEPGDADLGDDPRSGRRTRSLPDET